MSSTVPEGIVTPPNHGKPARISTTGTVKPHSPPLSQPTSPIRSISPPSPPPASTTFRTAPTSTSTPSSSQIFERNVQETSSAALTGAGASVPAHIATENHIPAVLEATSIAITDGSIDPENVEIAVLTSHQSLAAQNTMLHHQHQIQHGNPQHLAPSPPQSPPTSSAGSPHLQSSINASPSQSSSTSDARRRLSFISFSDIVQAEQADLLDSTILSPNPTQTTIPGAASVMDQVGISGITETLVRRRTPSPMRYGGSSSGRAVSPVSFLGTRVPLHRGPEEEREDVLVQTMSQALRKTGSGDLGRSL